MSDLSIPTSGDQYDVIVIGAGPAGENVAGPAAAAGLSCAVVESGLAGGECSYYACIPSKALLHPLQVRAEARRTDGLSEPAIDVPAVLAARDDQINHLDDSSQADWIEQASATLVRGAGRVVGPRQVEVDTADGTVALTARHAVVIATGTDPARPPIPGLDEVPTWTNRDALVAGQLPGRLAVVGGGPVGVELAQTMSGLGVEVTLLIREPGVLVRMEEFVGRQIVEQFRRDGIDVRLEAAVERVEATADGGARIVLGGSDPVDVDRVLLATGRTSRTAGLGLERYGVQPGRPVPVDDLLTVATGDGEWLYAVGDVNGRDPLTHMGKYQARIATQTIVARAQGTAPPSRGAWADTVGPPQVVFTDPQAGSVGLTGSAASEAGLVTDTVSVGFDSVAATGLQGWGGRGTAMLVIDRERQVVVGATFVGADVGELVHAATVAIIGEVPIERLWHAVPSFPTVSEIWLRLLEAYDAPDSQ